MPSHVLQEENSTIPDRLFPNNISNPDPGDKTHQKDIQNGELACLYCEGRALLFNYLVNFIYQTDDNNSPLEQELNIFKV